MKNFSVCVCVYYRQRFEICLVELDIRKLVRSFFSPLHPPILISFISFILWNFIQNLTFSEELNLLRDGRNEIVQLINAVVCALDTSKEGFNTYTYDNTTDKLLAEAKKKDLPFTTACINFIRMAANEYVAYRNNSWAKEITLNMYGRLLQAYQSGDGGPAKCP